MSKSDTSGVGSYTIEGQMPLVLPPSSRQLWSQALGVATAPFADPARANVMLPALASLVEAGATARFSNHTGLVRLLRGPLRRTRVSNRDDARGAALSFLWEHQRAIFGSDQERLDSDDESIAIGSTVYFRQIGRDSIPIYGAVVACDYDRAGDLRMLTSTWYPLPEDLGGFDLFRLPQERAFEAAIAAVRELLFKELKELSQSGNMIDPSIYEKAIVALQAMPGARRKRGRVIAPVLRLRAHAKRAQRQKGTYRAAWVVRVLDRMLYRSWEVLVDAEGETGAVLGVAMASHQLDVYLTDADATTHTLTPQPAASVNLPQVQLAPGGTNGLRQSNVLYHLTRAAEIFEIIAQEAWPQPLAQLPGLPGRLGGCTLTVALETAGTSWYDPGNDISGTNDGTIRFGLGQSNPKVLDAALDQEVIFHEYAHAVVNALQPDIVDKFQPELFRRAIDEGLAFYFGCSFSERLAKQAVPYRWGDYAYGQNVWTKRVSRDLQREIAKQQAAGFDYLSIYGSFPHYDKALFSSNEPTNQKYYACAMLWARALWDIRRVLGLETADKTILRALPLISGVQTELETAAEALIHADAVLAEAAGPTHENALRLIFGSRGIMADTPVNDIRIVTMGGQQCLLAAAERPDSGQFGCLISQDNGDSWTRLGVGGPIDVSAVAVAQTSAYESVVLAAADGPSGGAPAVYRYDLKLTNSNGEPDVTQSWVPLPPLPIQDGILALAMTQPDAHGACRVFAGTERGLYYDDAGSWVKAPISPDDPIRSLALLQTPIGAATTILFAAGRCRTYAVEPNHLAEISEAQCDTLPFVETLAVAAAPGQTASAWVGLWDGRVYQFGPNQIGSPDKQWLPLVSLPGQRPVYCLLPHDSGGQLVLYAGTSDGVWYLQLGIGASWKRIAGSADANFDGCTVVALGRSGHYLLAGTLERGIWRTDITAAVTAWERLANGLPRIGRLVDAEVPASGGGTYPFSGQQLKKNQRATYVVHVPEGYDSLALELEPNGEAAQLAVFYAAPYVDLGRYPAYAAGLSQQQPEDGHIYSPDPGYYLLVVTANQYITEYQLNVEVV